MSAHTPFTVISSLLYPFAILMAAAGLVAGLSRFRAYRELVRRRQSLHWGRDGLVGGLLLCLLSLISFRPMPHFSSLFGYVAGVRAACLASLLLSGCMLLAGWSVECLVACWWAGPVGSLLARLGRPGRVAVVASAAVWPPLAWKFDWLPAVFYRHLGGLPEQQLSWMFLGLSLMAALQTALLLWAIEYFAQREAHRSGRMLWRMMSLFDAVLTALRQPLPNLELCRAMSMVTESPCLAVSSTGQVIASDTALVLRQQSPALDRFFEHGEPEVCATTELLVDSSYPKTVVMPLYDGEQTWCVLLLPVREDHPLAVADAALVKAIGSLLTGELSGQRVLRQQAVLEATRYRMLAAQIEPHFLFNSLTTVASLALSDPERAHDLVVDLAHSLRPRFASGDQPIRLCEELQSLRSYLAIEKARYGPRLQIAWEVEPEAEPCLVPPMLLQPLLENAIRHGIAAREGSEPGLVGLQVRRQASELSFVISDNGAGFSQPVQGDGAGLIVLERGHGVGLSNVRERLYAYAGPSCRFHIDSTPGRGTVVSYRLEALTSPTGCPLLVPATATKHQQ